MGMPLPDLPPSPARDAKGWRFAYNYLREHGPSTVEEIVGERHRQKCHNMSTILRVNPQLFVKVGEKKRASGSGGHPPIWALKE